MPSVLHRRDVLNAGVVELLDVMGDDHEPARAARVSRGKYDEDRAWEGGDERLTRFLHDNRHTTPFEMIELKWRVRMPIFVARQWHRHRTANINEVSARYAPLPDDFWLPEHLRIQDKTGNLQGSSDEHPMSAEFIARMKASFDESYALYEEMLEANVSREQARAVLPVSIYTEFIWKNDMHNTLHFLALRADSHAQEEIRVYAEAMADILSVQFPLLWPVIWP